MLISSCIRKTLNQTRPANILVLPYDGLFESTLPQSHNIYGLNNLAFKSIWNLRPFNNKPIDFILVNERVSQLNNARYLSNQFQVPIIIVYHNYPASSLTPIDLHILNDVTKQYRKIAITQEITKAWKIPDADVIGYELLEYNYKEDNRFIDVLITNVNEHLDGLAYLKNNITNMQVSEKYCNHADLCLQSKIYINLATDYNLSIGLLQAIKCGCKIISTETPILKDLFKNNEIHFVQYLNEIPFLVQQLLKEPNNYSALDIINGKFTNGLNNWNKLFCDSKDLLYERY